MRPSVQTRGEGAVLVIRRLVKRGHVYAANARQTAQALPAADPFPLAGLYHVDGLVRALLAVSDDEGIGELVERSGLKAQGRRQHCGVVPGALLA